LWWDRWQKATNGPVDLARYAQMGVDYIVLNTSHRLNGTKPDFENVRFVVYRTMMTH
jgi:hypothetical protein